MLLMQAESMQQCGGHFFLSKNTTFPPNNGAIHSTMQIIKAVMLSAMEADLGALYINAKHSALLHHTLNELGHPQPPMLIQTDNPMA